MTGIERTTRSLQRKNVWIAGAARSGIAAAVLLRRHGISSFVTDSGKISDTTKRTLEENDISFEEGNHSTSRFERECDLLVLSPAILLNKSIAWEALRNRIPIVSEVELASWFLEPESTVIGITGTNGKSTVTNYISQLLMSAGIPSVPCGNFGIPLAQAISAEHKKTVFAVELSSYQLETTYSLRPQASMLLNLQPDHQARYGNMDEYLKAKWRLMLLTADTGVACIDSSVYAHAQRLGLPLPRCETIILNSQWPTQPHLPEFLVKRLSFARTLPSSMYGDLNTAPPDHLLSHVRLGFANYQRHPSRSVSVEISLEHKKHEFTIDDPCIPGEHNVRNILAASAVGLHLGVNQDFITRQWERVSSKYRHIPHRLEEIGDGQATFIDRQGKKKKVRLVNDSKATNVESLLVALRSYDKPVRLLIGGDPKGESFAALKPFLLNPICRFYPFGKAAPQIVSDLTEIPPEHMAPPQKSLFSAAENSLEEAEDGDVILLSPACASFDEFSNFEHRGDQFREWAEAHLSSKRKT